MKKKLKYLVIILVVIIGYKMGGLILDKLYYSKYDIVSYMGQDRFKTNNTVIDKRFKKADTAIIVNTNWIDQLASVASYAYQENIPVFYTQREKIMEPVYEEMEKLGVKKVIIIGGIDAISDAAVRSLDRMGYKSERIVGARGSEISIELANMLAKKKKVNEIAVVTRSEFDVANALSFSPYAQRHGIPIIVTTNNEDDVMDLKKFIEENKIKKVYVLSNEGFVGSNLEKMLPNPELMGGEDKYEVNKNIIEKLYDKNNEKIFISKGGKLRHKRHVTPGELVNAIAIAPLAADYNSPILYINNNYFTTEESEFIKEKGYKELNEVGFNIERRDFFNVERFKLPTTIIIILITWMIGFRMFSLKADN